LEQQAQMFNQLHQLTNHSSFRLKAKGWCALVALVTSLAFISLVSTAVTHHHTTTQESQDCSICSAVSNKVVGPVAAPVVVLTQFFLLFALAVSALRSSSYRTESLLPPSCGPPGLI
jgi:hypothetical protein